MKAKDFCRSAEIELTTWKAKIYDVVGKIDKLPTGDKEKMLGSKVDAIEKEAFAYDFGG